MIPENSNAKMVITPTVKQPRVNIRAAVDAGHNNIGKSINGQDTTNMANASQCQRLVKRHVVLFELSPVISYPCQGTSGHYVAFRSAKPMFSGTFAERKATRKHLLVVRGTCY